ncbi:hypothetical protein Lal_00022876 [Lupinus albus]|nr:hypothetical protein Lal_00022876 [Lupinus albus]
MVSHILRIDPTYPKQVSKGRRELESRVLPFLKLLDDSHECDALAQARVLSLKRESHSLQSFRVTFLAQARQLSLTREHSRSSEDPLAQARILQYSPVFHSPRMSHMSYPTLIT